jgi:hypothetical protein
MFFSVRLNLRRQRLGGSTAQENISKTHISTNVLNVGHIAVIQAARKTYIGRSSSEVFPEQKGGPCLKNN